MERLITLWQNMTIEQMVITLLMVAVFILFKRIAELNERYASLDKLSLLMASKIDPRMVRLHRNGDYEIVHPFNNPPTLDDVV